MEPPSTSQDSFKEVPLYRSDSDSDEAEDQPAKKTRGSKQNWIFVNKFMNTCAAEEVVSSENTWSILTTHVTMEGKKRFYRCNKVKRKGKQCAAQVYLLFEADSDAVSLYRTDADHNHDSIHNNYSFGICDKAKNEINKLFELRMKPRAILDRLSEVKGIKMPTKTQLNNYLCERRRTKNEQTIVHLGELEAWLVSNTAVPIDKNEVFVIASQTSASATSSFCFALSTMNLLGRASFTENLHVNTTSKLFWQGFPIFIIGTSDKNQKFLPICFAVCTNESKLDFKVIFEGLKYTIFSTWSQNFEPKTLVCDGSKAVQDAFAEVFGTETSVRMCWTQAKKKMCSQLGQSMDKNIRKEILEDINALQSATSPEVFQGTSQSFLEKWMDQSSFVAYFKQEWLEQNPNWYLGATSYAPETNNALDSFIKTIKDQNIIRERIPLPRFLMLITEMVKNWSCQTVEDKFSTTPHVDISNWRAGYQWARKNAKIKMVTSEDTMATFLVADDSPENAIDDKSWDSFDEYKKVFFSSWKVRLPKQEEEWINGRCDCPQFFRKYICKYLVGLAIRLKYVAPPAEAKIEDKTPKRKRGRPSRPATALIIP